MICVPTPPCCRSRSARSAGQILEEIVEKPLGNTGNARSSTMPIISQWPVTESLPGEASPCGRSPTARPAERADRPRAQMDEAIQTQRPQRRDCQRESPGDVPQRIAALVAVRRGVGQLANPHAVEDDDDGAAEWRGHARY
jgi:hypothetical protein